MGASVCMYACVVTHSPKQAWRVQCRILLAGPRLKPPVIACRVSATAAHRKSRTYTCTYITSSSPSQPHQSSTLPVAEADAIAMQHMQQQHHTHAVRYGILRACLPAALHTPQYRLGSL